LECDEVAPDGSCNRPDVYWSINADGNPRMSEAQMMAWGLLFPDIRIDVGVINVATNDIMMVNDLFGHLNFKSNTENLASRLGLPLARINLGKGLCFFVKRIELLINDQPGITK